MASSCPFVFELTLHLGTLLAIILVYRFDIGRIFKFALRDGWRREALEHGAGPPPSRWAKWRASEDGWIIPCVLVASVPTAAIGLMFEDTFEALFGNPVAVGVALLITGGLLWLSRLGKPRADTITAISLPVAFIIGVVQGLAITPGISRSGSTIAIALLLGVGRQSAGKFSFLMCVPAILGALALKLADGLSDGLLLTAAYIDAMILGLIISFISGYLALKLLLGFVSSGRLSWWSWYCWAVGGWAIVWFGWLG